MRPSIETMNALLGYLTENCCGGAPNMRARRCLQPARKRSESFRLTKE